MANSNVKATRSNTLAKIISANGNCTLSADELQVLINLKASVDRKSASDKPSKTQVENVGIKEVIVSTLATMPNGGTVTVIQKSNEELATLSNQKISALLRQLIEDGKVTKSTDKKVSTFRLV